MLYMLRPIPLQNYDKLRAESDSFVVVFVYMSIHKLGLNAFEAWHQALPAFRLNFLFSNEYSNSSV